jgi:ureidoglycolate lyase
MKRLVLQALTAQAFAPFGSVVSCEGAHHYPINEGTTQRYDELARVETGPLACAIISIFRGQPRVFPLTIGFLERHPLGSQTFMPLERRPYLVVVAESIAGSAVPGHLHAFVAKCDQGVHYAAGTWHYPLIAVDQVSDFLVVDRRGEGDNCEEVKLPEPYILDHP